MLTELLESRQLLATVYDGFGDLPLATNSHWNGPDVAGTEVPDPFGGPLPIKEGSFQSRGIQFENSFNANYGNWDGFAYSNEHDRTTAGFGNQFSSYSNGTTGGFDDANFGVVFDPGEDPTLTLPAGATIVDVKVTNITYAALSMRDGDDFAKKFGGASGNDPDFFKLTAHGDNGESAEIFLADFRFADNSQDYILDTWQTFDLSALAGSSKISFDLTSSDNGPFGMNTPATFAIDVIRYNLPEANAAPVLDNSLDPALITINEDVTNPAGTLVSSLIAGAVTDSNAAALQGIAVVNVQGTANGRWEFSRNEGDTWQLMNQPTESSALLLTSDVHTRVRFVPKANFNGQAQLTFRAWDQTQGTPGGRLSTSGRTGGSGPFSSDSETAAITVNAVNDAPALATNPKPTLGVVPSDTPEADVPGVEVSTLLEGATDVDAGSTVGIAVVDLTEKPRGTWQFSIDGGTSWTAFGTPSESSALRLGPTDQVRFVPNAGYHGTPQLKFRAWDTTDGAAAGSTGSTVGQTGGTKAYSANAVSAKLTVEANPLLNVGGTIGYVRNSFPTILAQTATLTDPDSPDFGQGSLFIRITTGGENANRLQIGSQFTIQGMVLGQAEIKFGATVIGTTTAPGGVSSTNLLINFNSNATVSIVQTLIRSITFGTVTGSSAGTRTIVYTLTDGDGGSVERTKLVNVT